MDVAEADAGRVTVHAGWLGGAGSDRARSDDSGVGQGGEGSGAGPPGAGEAGGETRAADAGRREDGPVGTCLGASPREGGASEVRGPDADAPPADPPEDASRHGEEAAANDRLAAAVGEQMARARAARGLSQARLARLVGVERPTVCRWERGLRSPSLHALLRVAAALGVPAAALLPEAVAAGDRGEA